MKLSKADWRVLEKACREYAEALKATHSIHPYFHENYVNGVSAPWITLCRRQRRWTTQSSGVAYNAANDALKPHLSQHKQHVDGTTAYASWGWYCPLLVAQVIRREFL